MVPRFPRNRRLCVPLALVSWDAVQRRFMPAQVDFEFAYSVLEIAALNLAFALQLGRTYDAWLARAFPQLPEHVLIDATGRLEEARLRPGERAEHAAARLFIVTRGTGLLLREGPGGHAILLGVLTPGQ